ncbi:hypothetical protein DdX_13462 [Ditylenchus destructor]|uniref:Uncharacterized protein n=1 Tax=Ditylenchus destructor TaxID=166010 RepID=A0AAD4MTJ2_9BILA|nr:hypothetical protein DdX_13462 [Ditylenchus destructor]
MALPVKQDFLTSPLGFGRVIRQSLPLGERRRLVPVSSQNRASTGRYGFRKSEKSWIWPGHRSSVAARIWAWDMSIASSRREKTIAWMDFDAIWCYTIDASRNTEKFIFYIELFKQSLADFTFGTRELPSESLSLAKDTIE